ncbi:Uncharacterised protein [BD1-7 clade bacterium]|uniref:HTH tetR-type domain-containing protein n=1 Tax=BD1-7 clade bacterium TaxID=2029982 RepID=A0A5S9NZ37_9GAMM|nr:Uncharacterised protein [BD1-7 clade bacterium]CAA0096146.1 Uncharacterised protein [BD1-7 clade bacterium]
MTKALRTRQKILDTAAQLIYEHGLSRFRIDDLVADVGITRQTFYRYFKNKNEVMTAVVVANGIKLAERVFDELTAMQLSFEDFLVEGVVHSVEVIKSEDSFYRFLEDDLTPAVGIMIENFLTVEQAMLPLADPYIERARESGIVKAEVTTHDILRWIFRAFLSEMLLSGLEPVEARRNYLKKMLVPSICYDLR